MLTGVAGHAPRGESVSGGTDSAAKYRNALGDEHRQLLTCDLPHKDIDEVPGDDLFEIGATDRLAFHRKKATSKATSGAMTRALAWRPFRKVATPLIGEDHWRSMNTCLPHDDAPYTNDGMRLHPCRQGHFVPNSSHHHAEIQPAEEWYVPRNRRH